MTFYEVSFFERFSSFGQNPPISANKEKGIALFLFEIFFHSKYSKNFLTRCTTYRKIFTKFRKFSRKMMSEKKNF